MIVSAQTAQPSLICTQKQVQIAHAPACFCDMLLTGGAKWSISSGWCGGGSPCDGWHGVYCAQGVIWEINLYGNLLSGSIGAELAKLTTLESLLLDEVSQFAVLTLIVGQRVWLGHVTVF